MPNQCTLTTAQHDHLFAALLTDRPEEHRFRSILRLRHQLRSPHAVVVASNAPEADLLRLGTGIRARLHGSSLVAAADDASPHVAWVIRAEEPGRATWAVSVAVEEARPLSVLITAQAPVVGPRALCASYHRAVVNGALARHARLPGPLIDPRDLVMPRIFSALDDGERALLLSPLRAVLDLTSAHRDSYVKTLIALLTTGSLAAAAEQLHIHVNSVRYRLARIEDLTGLSPDHVGDRLSLNIAAMLASFLENVQRSVDGELHAALAH